jgi:hypothetical protein
MLLAGMDLLVPVIISWKSCSITPSLAWTVVWDVQRTRSTSQWRWRSKQIPIEPLAGLGLHAALRP